MLDDSERITWLASYPKSGNTWIRCLLQAYRCNGYLDINDMHTGVGDSSACFTSAVSPLTLDDLGDRGQWLLRPAALLNALMAMKPPRMFKTHYANVTISGLPAFIPPELTQRAIYILRDPRSVALSVSRFLNISMDRAVEQMANKNFQIGEYDNGLQVPQIISSWSNNVKSWVSQTIYPVHIVKYEDMLIDPAKELRECLEFMGLEPDSERIERSVESAELSRLRKTETEQGFSEYKHRPEIGPFFNEGGTRWQHELAPKWVEQIEKDHGELMRELGYLDKQVLYAVEQ